MKKTLTLLIMLVLNVFMACAQDQKFTGTKTFTSPPKFLNLDEGTKNDSLVGKSTNGTIKYIKQSSIGEESHNNFIRTLVIQQNLLSGSGSMEQQICDYILNLPEGERTIAKTDSKWNIIIIQQVLVQAMMSSLQSDYCLGELMPTDTAIYHTGSGEYPVEGDIVYSDVGGTVFYPESEGRTTQDPDGYSLPNGTKLTIDGGGVAHTFDCK